MKMAFTICSINYLAQAKGLGDSLLANNPEYEFVICLIDKLTESGVDADLLPSYKIVEAEEIGIADWPELTKKYNVIELNTSVKASFFKYLFAKYSPESVIFFDPDILILSSLRRIEMALKEFSIVLTPHACTPVTYSNGLPERAFLNYGIFNLGFIALSNTSTAAKFLEWWEDRLIKECYIDTYNGLYVDQLWINLVPAYFNEVYIDKYLGNNVAFWNLHERKIIFENNEYLVNDYKTPLVFFHFSKVKIDARGFVAGMTTIDIEGPAYDGFGLKKLIHDYADRMIANQYSRLRQYQCFYEKTTEKNRRRRIKKNLPGFVKKPLISFSKKILGIKDDDYYL
jgi:hypothetical protein